MLPGSRRARIAGVVIAAVAAGGLHAALAVGELALRRDETYAQTMQPERARVIARELGEWQAREAARGAQVTAQAARAEQARLERVHRSFPFAWVLGVAVAGAVIAGAFRAKPSRAGPIANRLLATAAIVAAVAICAVIAIATVLAR